jgi:hypothetical protein
MRIDSSGNIGIGTTTPAQMLEVDKSVAGSGFLGYFHNTSSTGSAYVELQGGTGSNVSQLGAANNCDFMLSTGATEGTFSNERLRVTSAGNVGIGTSSPGSKLTVVGDTSLTGNLNATGNISAQGTIHANYSQDVAEWVPSSQPLTGGTVVILDPAKSNTVTASSRAYDTRVAGVVSNRPGLILGEGGAGKASIATTGRVKVKVDATNSGIAIGDLLVTSGVSGYAMRSEPVNLGGVEIHRPGTLIGKALEPMPKGKKGEVLVLLSLQ